MTFILPKAFVSEMTGCDHCDDESIRLDATDYLKSIALSERMYKEFGENGPTPEQRLLMTIFGY